jgi:hypothetical protein
MELERKELCPLWKKKCIQLDCVWFIKVAGTDPADKDRQIEEWGCAVNFQFMGLLEVAKRVSGGLDGVQKATESMRNEVVKTTSQTLDALVEIARRDALQLNGGHHAIDHRSE